MSSIKKRYQTIQQELQAACERAGRDVHGVKIVAVSKTVSFPEIKEAIAAGIHDFAENRSVLFKERQNAFPQERWHFIGTIQTNKVKDFTGHATLVHSVASERALRAIHARMCHLVKTGEAPACATQPILIEVNVAGERTKDGVTPNELEGLLHAAESLTYMKVQGLMTMAPQSNEATIRSVFRELRIMRDTLAARFEHSRRIRLTELSMGMSEDYVIAAEEGATIIRVGRKVWQNA